MFYHELSCFQHKDYQLDCKIFIFATKIENDVKASNFEVKETSNDKI